ncbi:beta-ketoacyl-ACP synthase III [Mycobacterium sp. PDNC021]|uniref:beta-ketoacyl-ACP synthase III n=1 Tax=Mycobacterium sp. PDNC021 TaxID=3391399 RepID=UPI003AAA752B
MMLRSAKVVGLGGYVPPQVVSNHQLAETLDTNDEWIRTRTGISHRHIVTDGTATSDLATIAGRRALDNVSGDSTIDLLVLATTTPDHPCPATAPAVASALGLGCIPAYDLAAVCSGFIYGLSAATATVKSGMARRALVIGAETFSTILDPSDRTTRPIFGDGAGAVVIEAAQPGAEGEVIDFILGSDGDQSNLICVPAGGSRERTASDPDTMYSPFFQMQGAAVFREAVARMSQSCEQVMAQTGWSAEQVDWLVGHQANARIIAAIGDQLGVSADRAVINLDRVGNTSAASIPLALADAASAGRFQPGQRIVLTAFGGGTTWGATTLTWPAIPSVVPIDTAQAAYLRTA